MNKSHTYTVQITGCTAEQAEQVMAERMGYDEDMGFEYTIEYTGETTGHTPARTRPSEMNYNSHIPVCGEAVCPHTPQHIDIRLDRIINPQDYEAMGRARVRSAAQTGSDRE